MRVAEVDGFQNGVAVLQNGVMGISSASVYGSCGVFTL